MSNPVPSPSYLTRLVAHEATKRGIAAALAGVIVAAVSSLWDSTES